MRRIPSLISQTFKLSKLSQPKVLRHWFTEQWLLQHMLAPALDGPYAIYGTGRLGQYLYQHLPYAPKGFVQTQISQPSLFQLPVVSPETLKDSLPEVNTVVIASLAYEQAMKEAIVAHCQGHEQESDDARGMRILSFSDFW